MLNRFAKFMGNATGNAVRGAGVQAKQAGKTMIKSGAAGFVFWGGVDTWSNMQQGDDFGTALVKGAASGMLWTVAPWTMSAITFAPMAKDLGVALYNKKLERIQWWQKQHAPNFGGNYQDTQRALTMRQAAVQQIQASKLNARSALGGEAKILAERMFRG